MSKQIWAHVALTAHTEKQGPILRVQEKSSHLTPNPIILAVLMMEKKEWSKEKAKQTGQ